MREIALPRVTNRLVERSDIYSLTKQRSQWLIGFIFSAILGAALGITGITISGLVSLGLSAKESALNNFDTLLFAGMFPLIILAAHCLDKAGDAKKAIKAITYKRK